MVNIKQQLVTSRKYTYAGTNPKRYITIHETANYDKGAGAQRHADLQTNGFSSSFHWQVDDKVAIQSFPHSVRCWHGGDGRGEGNMSSIAIEVCVNKDSDFATAIRNTAALVRKIMRDEKIPIERVVQHNHWSGKNCPTNLRNGSKGINWAGFINLVDLGSPVINPVIQTKPVPTKPAPSKPAPTKQPAASNLIRIGDKGSNVKSLQSKLIAKGYSVGKFGADGVFGNATLLAVRAIQRDSGLVQDGIVGKDTTRALNATVSKPTSSLPGGLIRQGARGANVRLIQQALADKYFYPQKGARNNGVDGIWGSKTTDALKRFQSMNGLKADGIYGPSTKKSLEK